jgi:hypothetical protein
MNSFERVVAEWETIKDSQFWAEFIGRIMNMRALASRDCEQLEDSRKSQGAVKVLDDIIGRGENKPPLAERLLEELRQKSKNGG